MHDHCATPYACMPADFVLDLNFRVLQAGEALKRMLPQMGELDTDVREVLTVSLASSRGMWLR